MCKQHTVYWYCRRCSRQVLRDSKPFDICDEAFRRGAPGRCKDRIKDTNERYVHPNSCRTVLKKPCRGEEIVDSGNNNYVDEDGDKDKDGDQDQGKDKGKGKDKEDKESSKIKKSKGKGKEKEKGDSSRWWM
ncbi:hypothetical protein HJFPF1_05657 [Paramyrothecium foliicola]|nr:hypothetical protein HJFPF1_05657 [Paramyrothecium foliicola]